MCRHFKPRALAPGLARWQSAYNWLTCSAPKQLHRHVSFSLPSLTGGATAPEAYGPSCTGNGGAASHAHWSQTWSPKYCSPAIPRTSRSTTGAVRTCGGALIMEQLLRANSRPTTYSLKSKVSRPGCIDQAEGHCGLYGLQHSRAAFAIRQGALQYAARQNYICNAPKTSTVCHVFRLHFQRVNYYYNLRYAKTTLAACQRLLQVATCNLPRLRFTA